MCFIHSSQFDVLAQVAVTNHKPGILAYSGLQTRGPEFANAWSRVCKQVEHAWHHAFAKAWTRVCKRVVPRLQTRGLGFANACSPGLQTRGGGWVHVILKLGASANAG